MHLGFILGVGLVVVVLAYGVSIYNSLVRLKHNAVTAWSNIDVLLKQRHDELPKLVEVCKQYLQYEQPALERIVQARANVAQARQAGSPEAVGRAESELRGGLANLYAVAENYPDLKANESFRALQSRVSGLENAIADRRESYNDTANDLNIRREQFPDRIVAGIAHIRSMELLKFASAELSDVDMKALFS
ncbi:LemA family protein [Frateuria sp.]|uniref:LemA family protein n=1 Tax=Frateuria sp. TaxID=2211372 RepID=UPI003F7D654A